MPWFCPKPLVFSQVVGFPVGLSSRTTQGLGSVQNLWFILRLLVSPQTLVRGPYNTLVLSKTFGFFLGSWFPHWPKSEDHTRPQFSPKPLVFSQVVGFPIGLSPRTIQCLGSVQNLWFFLRQLVSPQTLVRGPYNTLVPSKTFGFFLGGWFPHSLVSEDHTRPQFCPEP